MGHASICPGLPHTGSALDGKWAPVRRQLKFRALTEVLLAMLRCIAALCVLIPLTGSKSAADDWTFVPVRPELVPEFRQERAKRSTGATELTIIADDREGLAGAWVKTFPIEGGQHYRFSCRRKTTGIESPRRSALVKVTWLDDAGRLVEADHGDRARPEYPLHERPIGAGLTEISDLYFVPAGALQARVELQLRWATNGTVRWSDVSLEPVDAPSPRNVRLAAVHFRPQGGETAADNREMFAPLIAEAARQQADLVCLGECITKVGNGLTHVESAEPIPGPSTEYFGRLSDQHDLYLVIGLTERDGEVIYNTSVMMGPEGERVGKYRKVCLPREEIEGGVTPGNEYPVFDTRFGKVGMMICWDVHFPEVSRELANNGAEVIAMPVWGGNPRLAAARAIENQVYLITSTYNTRSDWMVTGIWDHRGDLLAQGEEWGTVVVSEVDLNQRTQWWWLGDFKARLHRERPAD